MVKFEITMHIDRPPADVFKYMTDPAKVTEWNSIVEEAKANETPTRVGTRIQMTTRFLGRKMMGTSEVTEYEPNKRSVMKGEEPFPTKLTNTFEAEGGGTKVVAGFEAEPAGFFKLGEPILNRIAKKQMQAQLETAKEILEAQVPAAR